MAKVMVRTDEGEWVEGYGNLRVIDGPSQNSEVVTLPNGNAVAPGAAAVLREFGVEVGGGPEPWAAAERELAALNEAGKIKDLSLTFPNATGWKGEYRFVDLDGQGWVFAGERLEMAEKALGAARRLVASSPNPSQSGPLPPWAAAEAELDTAVASGRIFSWGFDGDTTGRWTYFVRPTGADMPVQFESSADRATAARTAAGAVMSDQAVRDELWTLGWRLDGSAWTNGHWDEWLGSDTERGHARRALVEARRLAAEEKAGGQG